MIPVDLIPQMRPWAIWREHMADGLINPYAHPLLWQGLGRALARQIRRMQADPSDETRHRARCLEVGLLAHQGIRAYVRRLANWADEELIWAIEEGWRHCPPELRGDVRREATRQRLALQYNVEAREALAEVVRARLRK